LAGAARQSVVSRYGREVVMPLLQHVVSLVMKAKDRDHLASLLDEDASLISRVSGAEIEGILGNSMGRVGLRQRALMHVIHQPTLYRAYRGFRDLVSR
jgi:hypothetical protein